MVSQYPAPLPLPKALLVEPMARLLVCQNLDSSCRPLLLLLSGVSGEIPQYCVICQQELSRIGGVILQFSFIIIKRRLVLQVCHLDIKFFGCHERVQDLVGRLVAHELIVFCCSNHEVCFCIGVIVEVCYSVKEATMFEDAIQISSHCRWIWIHVQFRWTVYGVFCSLLLANLGAVPYVDRLVIAGARELVVIDWRPFKTDYRIFVILKDV